MTATDIERVEIWEALDSRGRPTVSARVTLRGGAAAEAIAPSGASTGRFEATEARDGGSRYGGYGTREACQRLERDLGRILPGRDAADLTSVAEGLDVAGADGSPMGGNVGTAVSVAAMTAAARQAGQEPWRWLADKEGVQPTLPLPMVNVVSGGAHANAGVDVQDVLVVPMGANSFSEALELVWRVRVAAAALAAERGTPSWLVADEGGIGLVSGSNEQALELVADAVVAAGLRPGTDVALALDVAANQLLVDGQYQLACENRCLTTENFVAEIVRWCRQYGIVSVEDPVQDADLGGWALACDALSGLQCLGDDLIGTQTERVGPAAEVGVNAVLVKVNQAGSLGRARDVVHEARRRGLATVVSARSGDTEEHWLADLAVGWAAGQIKVGSLTRSERTAKWNRLLSLEHRFGGSIPYAGRAALAAA